MDPIKSKVAGSWLPKFDKMGRGGVDRPGESHDSGYTEVFNLTGEEVGAKNTKIIVEGKETFLHHKKPLK